jgi:hypothetical protein
VTESAAKGNAITPAGRAGLGRLANAAEIQDYRALNFRASVLGSAHRGALDTRGAREYVGALAYAGAVVTGVTVACGAYE